MIAAWMLYTLLVGGLVALAARATETLLRARALPARAAWAAAVVLMLALPVLTAFRAPAGESRPAATATGAARTLEVAAPSRAAATFEARPALDRPLLMAWAMASLALLGLLVHGAGVLRGRRREWREAEVEGRRLLVSADVGPAVVGWRRMQVVVPAWVLGLDRESRGIVLAHEEEHIQRQDPRLLLVALLATVLVPWNLALWYATRRLRLAVELDCDARVVARGINRYRYGQVLLEAGRRTRTAGLPALATFAERATQLESRLSALVPGGSAGGPRRMVGAAGAAALLLAAACTMDNPLGIDLGERALPTEIQLVSAVAGAHNPAVVQMLVRRFAEARAQDALAAGTAPEPFIAVVVFDAQRRIVRVGARNRNGSHEDEISLDDLVGEQIASIEVIKGAAVGIDNVEGMILISLGEPRQAEGKTPSGSSAGSLTRVEGERPRPLVLLRQRNP